MKKIIHDWTDERAIVILRNCRDAMAPQGKVLIAETIIPAGNEPNPIKLIDVNMLVVTGGKERTQAEYTALLAAAGLGLERVISTSQSTATPSPPSARRPFACRITGTTPRYNDGAVRRFRRTSASHAFRLSSGVEKST